jgi:hypothetical protein
MESYGLEQRDLQSIMPAAKEIVQAWAMQLLMLGASQSLVRTSLVAVQSRHREFGFQAPLSEPKLFKRLMRLKHLTPGQRRDVALTVAGTQICARVGEIKRLQVCDFLMDYDVAYSRRYQGSAAKRIRKRKQDRS